MSSDLCGKIEHNTEINATAEKFHHLFAHKPHTLHNGTDKIQGVELLKGEWGIVGSHIVWNYVHDGKDKKHTDIIEGIDHEKNSITFRVIEGDLTEHYKTLVIALQVTTKSDGQGSVVHWTVEYEKHHRDVEDPRTFVQYLIEVSKDLDIQLLNEKE